MAVKVGNSWVSETALTYARSKADSGVSGWSISQDDAGNEVKHKTKLDKTKKDTWADKLKEKQTEKRTQEKRADNLSISSAGQESYKQLSSVSYQNYVDRFESTLSELEASNGDAAIQNHFDYHADQMSAAYEQMKSDIEAKYASDDYKPEYYIAESGRIEELTKDKELDMLKRAYESHSTLMATNTEIWAGLKNFTPNTVYSHSSSASNAAKTSSKIEAETGSTQKGHIRDIAYKAFMSAIGSDNLQLSANHTGSLNRLNLNLNISASDRSLLNSIWNYYAK